MRCVLCPQISSLANRSGLKYRRCLFWKWPCNAGKTVSASPPPSCRVAKQLRPTDNKPADVNNDGYCMDELVGHNTPRHRVVQSRTVAAVVSALACRRELTFIPHTAMHPRQGLARVWRKSRCFVWVSRETRTQWTVLTKILPSYWLSKNASSFSAKFPNPRNKF